MNRPANGAGRATAERAVALDLGTARTRTVAPGGVTVLDRPSCVPCPEDPGDRVWPIRHGMVVSMAACHRLARAILQEAMEQRAVGLRPRASQTSQTHQTSPAGQPHPSTSHNTGHDTGHDTGHNAGHNAGQNAGHKVEHKGEPPAGGSRGGASAGLSHAGASRPGTASTRVTGASVDRRADGLAGCRPERVILGVPVAATETERRAAQAAVARAADCPVVLVEEPLAAAIGCGVDVTDTRPRLLVDVGAGIVEAVVISDSAVAQAGALQISARTRGGLPGHAVDAVIDLVGDLVRRLPPYLRPAARANGLLLTGGGAVQQDLAARLRAGLRVAVHPATRPAHATIRGLARLCHTPDLATRVIAANPIDTKGTLE